MKAFVIVMLILNCLALHSRAQIVSGKKKRTELTPNQEAVGLILTAIFVLWGAAVLIFNWA